MNSMLRIVLFGVLVWAIPFLAGMLLFPLQPRAPELFNTLMSLAVCATGAGMGLLLMKKQTEHTRNNAILIGIKWAAICIIIDLPIFMLGLDMGINHYMSVIGMTYLMLPIILWALARASSIAAPSD